MNRQSILHILLKTLAAFIALNVIFVLLNPVAALGRISVYNTLVPGRERLPYGDVPAKAYNLSLYDLNAMFASHAISRAKPADEYRVVLIGDSSTWGWFLKPEDTLAGLLNAKQMKAKDGRTVRVYNLGYPIMSLTKDVLILRRALAYQPDLIVWPMSLESFPSKKQTTHPIVLNNMNSASQTFFERTLVGQRRRLADWLRLQAYGVMWAATGIDQYYPETYEPAARDLDANAGFSDLQPPTLHKDDLAFDVLNGGVKMASDAHVPLLVVNEPILISQGKNSDVRYNFFYPRWAYDQYRDMLRAHVTAGGITYLDAWEAVPQVEFTNSAVHLSPAGSRLFGDRVAQTLQAIIAP